MNFKARRWSIASLTPAAALLSTLGRYSALILSPSLPGGEVLSMACSIRTALVALPSPLFAGKWYSGKIADSWRHLKAHTCANKQHLFKPSI